ncbi:MAG: hypothetical protein ACEQSR_05205 [Candidatus Methylacidiphilales bacterium]
MKNKIIYQIGLLCGIIPLTVGLFIFFAWWIARAFFAIDLNSFEEYGFLWTIISIPIATIGLLLVTIFTIRNYPNFIRQSIFGFSLILINIPTAYWVLEKQADLDKRAYVKIYYKSGVVDLSELKLKSSYFEKNLGDLECLDSKVFYYYPKYVNERSRDSYSEIEPVTLILKTKKHAEIIKLRLPRIEKGQCLKLYIEKEFNLLTKWE